MQIPELLAQRKFISAVCHAHYNTHKPHAQNQNILAWLHSQATWVLSLQQNLRSKVQHNNIWRLHYRSHTADISTNEQLKTSTFADDTAILSRPRCPGRHLVERLLSDMRIEINEQKCKHIMFTLSRQTCPPLSLNSSRFPKSAKGHHGIFATKTSTGTSPFLP